MSWNLKNRNEVWNESTLFLLEILEICVGGLCLAGSRSIGFHPSITDCQRWGCSWPVFARSNPHPHAPAWSEQGCSPPKGQRKTDRGRLVSSSSTWWEIHGCCSAYWPLLSRQKSESKGAHSTPLFTRFEVAADPAGVVKMPPKQVKLTNPVCISCTELSSQVWVNQCWGIYWITCIIV